MKKKIRSLLSMVLCIALLLGNSYITQADPIGSFDPEPVNAEYLNYFATEKNVYYDNVGSTYLYIAKEDGLYRSLRSEENYLLYYEADIANSLIVGDHFYYTTPVQPQTIYYYNIQTGTTQVVANAESAVTEMRGNQDVIYFVSDGSLYRLHVASGIIDFILQLPDENYSHYTPISNRVVHVYLYRTDWLDYVAETGDELNIGEMPVEVCYRYNAMTKVGEQISEEEALEEINEMVTLDTTSLPAELQSFVPPSNFLSELIMPAYPAEAQDYPGTSYLKKYTATYKAAGTCVAFGLYAYDNEYYPHTLNSSVRYCDQNGEKNTTTATFTSAATAKTAVQSIPIGSIIAVRSVHWLTLAAYDTNYVWVYHANMFNDNAVQLHRMTYQQFYTVMQKVRFSYHPNNNTSHPHSYTFVGTGCNRYKRCTTCSVRLPNSTQHSYAYTSINDVFHTKSCNSCSYSNKEPHTYTAWAVDGLGMQYRYCTKCGYTQYV